MAALSLVTALLASATLKAVATTTTRTIACKDFTSAGCAVIADGISSSSSSSSPSQATAVYSDDKLAASGWWTLDMEVKAENTTVNSLLLGSFAMGVAEGAVSCKEMLQFGSNVLKSDFGRGPDAGANGELLTFIEENDAWVRKMVAENAEGDDYWLAVGQLVAQLDGLFVGLHNFSECATNPALEPLLLSQLDLLLVNLDGDLFDLQSAFPDNSKATTTAAGRSFRHGHLPSLEAATAGSELRCSALIKLTADQSDVFFGHSTWDTYATAAPRTFKSVRLPVRRAGEIVQHVDSFSSSPGFVASIDDYYVLDGTSELVVIETSNGVNNKSAYDYLSPETTMCFLRTMAANMLATGGQNWGELFSKYHSGTYVSANPDAAF